MSWGNMDDFSNGESLGMHFAGLRLLSLLLIYMPRGRLAITLTGTGASASKPCIDALLQNYTAWRKPNITLTGNFKSLKITDFNQEFPTLIKDLSFDFLTVLGLRDLTGFPTLVSFPIFAEPIVVIYRVLQTHTGKLLPHLSLTAAQYVGIFSGKLPLWSAVELTTAGIGLPKAAISLWLPEPRDGLHWQLVDKYTSLPSGFPAATQVSTDPQESELFHVVSSPFASMGGVAITDNSIGITTYTEYKKSFGDGSIFGAASLSNASSDLCSPDDNLSQSIAATTLNSDFQADIVLPENGAYPLGHFMFLVVRKSVDQGELDCNTQTELMRFVVWMLQSNESKEIIKRNNYTPLPSATLKTVQQALKQMRCGRGKASVYDELQKKLELESWRPNIALAVGLPVALLLLFLLIIRCFCNMTKTMFYIRLAQQQAYNVPDSRIKIIKASKEKYECMMHTRKYLEGRGSKPVFVVGEYKNDVVMLRCVDVVVTHIEFPLRLRLVQLMQDVRHPNVVRFYGLTELRHIQSKCFSISQFCPLGDLRTTLNNKRVELDAPIKFGMMKGITEGLFYLHTKGIVHGNLRSTAVYLEADWTTKISDWDLTCIEILSDKFRNRERIWRRDLSVEEEAIYLPPLLWSAPEILTAVTRDEVYRPTLACDVFSYAIIFFEVLTRDLPYEYNLVPHSMTYDQLFAMVRRPINPLRPLDFKEHDQTANAIPQSVVHIMKTGWAADPTDRPSIVKIRDVLMAISSEMKRLADLTIVHTRAQIEQYKRNIIKNNEETVELTKELERTKIDFLSRWVYEAHLKGEEIKPHFYQIVYVLRCALVNYDGLCSVTHGDAVLYFIDRFYRIIDQIIPSDHNIHRLHSNGDDITLVGAVPSGGVEYAAKMATLAFDMLVAIWNADLLDIDWERMEVRIGMSCGPAVAGIYGNIHRAFTVVGTTSEAAVMESAGATYRILITEAFYEALKLYPEFMTQLNTDEKHMLPDQKTFWLLKKEEYRLQNALDEIAMAYPPPDAGGQLVEVEDSLRRIRDRRNQQVAKASLPIQHTGSFIEKDPRSGYLIEHRNRTKDAPSVLSIARGGHATHHRQITSTQSGIFGSMLGPQGFTTLKNHYIKHKRKQRNSLEKQHTHDMTKLFAGQLGAMKEMGDVPLPQDTTAVGFPLHLPSTAPTASGFNFQTAFSHNEESSQNQLVLTEVPTAMFETAADSTGYGQQHSDDIIPTVEQRVAMYEETVPLEEDEDSEIRRELRKQLRRKKEKTRLHEEIGERLSSHSVMARTSLWVSQLPDVTVSPVPTEQGPEPLLTVNDDADVRERVKQSRHRKEHDHVRFHSRRPSRRRAGERVGAVGNVDLLVDIFDANDYVRQGVRCDGASRRNAGTDAPVGAEKTAGEADEVVDPVRVEPIEPVQDRSRSRRRRRHRHHRPVDASAAPTDDPPAEPDT